MKISKTNQILMFGAFAIGVALFFILMNSNSAQLFYAKGIKNLSIEESVEVLNDPRVKLIDVRNEEEFEVSHLKGADRYEPSIIPNLNPKDKIVLYCTVGVRSSRLAKQLQEKGFEQVYNMDGGIIEWKNAGYEVVDMNQSITEKVHVYNRFFGLWLKNGEGVK